MMPSKEKTRNNDKVASKRRLSQPPVRNINALTEQTDLAAIIQRARNDVNLLSPRDLWRVQRAIGNQAVGRLLLRSKDKSDQASQGTSKTQLETVSPSAPYIQHKEEGLMGNNIAFNEGAYQPVTQPTHRQPNQARLPVQRYVFLNEKQVEKTKKSYTKNMKKMARDKLVRNYNDETEFENHAAGKTDYLGNLGGKVKSGVWVRFNPGGINLLGENHTQVTLEDVVKAVGTTSFIYEPFSTDDMTKSPKMKKAYEKENKQRFKDFGVSKEKDKRKFGGESLFPKMGFGMTLAIPYFDGSKSIDELKSSGYVGQPIQRYLKIAWGYSKDNVNQVKQKRKAKENVPPNMDNLAKVHESVKPDLDKFITKLPVDGFLGDAIEKLGTKKWNKLSPLLTQFAKAFAEAMVELAADDKSLSVDRRAKVSSIKSTGPGGKEKLFSDWRNYHFEQAVEAAANQGVRYAGMGQNHLDYLIDNKVVPKNGHSYEMNGKHINEFESLTNKLKTAAKDVS